MGKTEMYTFSEEKRSMLEALLHPLAAYQFVDDHIVTLLVSDGMCRLSGMERAPLIQLFNTDMYRGTHPDDVERVAELAHRFIITENEYDVTYRTILYGKMEYRYLHAISRFQTMENGSRVAFTMYDDVTDLMKKEDENQKIVNAPKAQFLDENMSAMAVVGRATKKLLYYNKALTKMLPPKVSYDSGRTFQDFFYHGLTSPDGMPVAIAGLYDNIDIGPTTVTEPLTGRKMQVTTISSVWGDTPSYTLFFFEHEEKWKEYDEEQELRQRRMVFNSIMNGASSKNLEYYESGYQAYWIWNLTRDGKLVRESGHKQIHSRLGETFTYSQYWEFMNGLFDGSGDQEFAETVTLDGLRQMYLKGIVPKSRDFTVHNENGQVTMHTEFMLMQSPDDGDLYLKVTEENITDSVVQKTVLSTLVRKQFDFIIYIDARAGRCRMINGSTSNAAQEELSGSLTDYYRQVAVKIGAAAENYPELLSFIEGKCRKKEEVTYSYRISESSVKSIYMKVLNRASRQYFICSSDVTELLRHEEEGQLKLKKALEAAESANQAKSEFVSRISHDIRTPISIISGMTEFAMEDRDEPQKLQEDLSKIQSANTFLLSLINDVLDVSKIDSGKVSLEPKPYPYQNYVENIRNMFVAYCKDKEVDFEIEEDTQFKGELIIDEVRLNQITLNLLSNAVKYTLPGGKVSFRSKIEISSQNPGTLQLCFEVSDTGIGMSEKFIKKMFDPFTQEDDNPLRSKAVTGTGLGLSIVKKMMDLMGGTIQVESQLGKGTRIQCMIECPYLVSTSSKTALHTGKFGQNADFRKLSGHLLVAEDSAVNLEIILRILGRFGVTADTAENGRDVLEKFSQSKAYTYDAVLTDIRMPIMDGVEAAKKIRLLPGRLDAQKIPIIAMTADALSDASASGMQAGMNEYLVKPIDAGMLYRILQKYLAHEGEKR